ncbi:MAG: hypothetical protein M3464_09930 [Chloroflexota bacterium]|nr:hypothetical protein [Chloroflexota bacterium]
MIERGPASLYPSTVTVRGLTKARILDVNLTLHDFRHEYPGDVDLLLVSPAGRAAIVMSDAGSLHRADNLTIRLDDRAAAPLPFADALTSGSFQPANHDAGGSDDDLFPAPAPQGITNTALSIFRGANPNGRWKLFVSDDADSDDGLFTGGWTLTIKARITTRE